jgi:hypothetical protein
MWMSISQPIIKLAQIIKKTEGGLDPQDISILKKDGPEYMRHVHTNIKLGKKALDDLTDTAKKVLLAYVIFLRQNATIEEGNKPNEEDTAKVLHGEVYKKDTKEDDEEGSELDKELLKQLEKLGMNVKKDEDKKPKKG